MAANDDLNRWLRWELRKRHLTHEKLAKRLKTNRLSVTRRLGGTTPWSLSEIKKTSQILGFGSLSEMLAKADY